MINHKMKILSIAMLLLSGCSGSGSTGGTSAVPASAEEAITLENPVRLDQLGVLPASDSSAASFLLQLTNYSKDKYTLTSARAVDLTTGKDSTLVSVASQACSIVSANGSCSIQLTPHSSQSADVKLEVTLKDQNGASRTLFQLIRISGALNANSGGIAMINDIDRIVTEDGNYSLSIPVILGESYDDIKASNGSLLCNTAAYLKGSSCTYQVRGKVTGDSAVVSTRLEGIRADKTVTVEEASTKIEVAKGAHLLLSHGVKINHPESSAEITVFNSGNIDATDIAASVGNSSGLEIIDSASNSCGAKLEANEACKVKVKVKSSINGQAPVTVDYKDGTTGLTTLTNVRYKVAAATAGIEFSESSNTLSNAIVHGKERLVIINVKNTGNSNLTNVSYHLAPLGSTGLTLEKGVTNSCNLSDATLAVNTSCSLSVKYTPTVAQDKSSINLVLNGRYTDEHGLAHSLINTYGLSYSATEVSAGNLVWTTTSAKDILSIQSNNNDSESAIWKLSNTLAADENLSASAVNVSLNPAEINGLKVIPMDTVKCAPNATIVGNAACEYSVEYGPVSVDQVETKVKLKAEYTLDAKELASETSEFKVKADSIKTPKITASVNISANTTSSGDGTLNDPWSFTAYSNKLLKLTYTFKNEGNLAAEKFNIAASNLPSGAIVDSATTCKIGTETMKFEPNNASCDVVVIIPDPELFSAPNSPLVNLNSASLKLDLPYSYYDNGSLKRGSSDTKYVNFNRLWANVEHVLDGSQEDNSNYTVLVKSSAQIIADSGVKYPLTIKPFLKNPIAGVSLKECTVNDKSETCINEIVLPKDVFIPGTPLKVEFLTSASGVDDSDAILSSIEVKAVVPLLGAELATPLKMSDNRNVVPFDGFENKIINISGKEYPFELTLSAPNGGSNLVLSDIKLSNSSVLASGTKVTLAKDCNQENSLPANGNCRIQGMLEFTLADGLKWKDYENESMFLVLEATYNNQVLHSVPVRLNLDSILINARQVNLPATGIIKIKVGGLNSSYYHYKIPNGDNTGVIASPNVNKEWAGLGINTVKLHAINNATIAAPSDLSLFIGKGYTGADSFYTLNSGVSFNPPSFVGLTVDTGYISKANINVFDYEQQKKLDVDDYKNFNAGLASGTYQAGFYIYGINWNDPKSSNIIEYIQLNYEHKE